MPKISFQQKKQHPRGGRTAAAASSFARKQNPSTSSSDHHLPAVTAPLHSYLPPTIIAARKVSFEDAQDPLLTKSNDGSSLASATKILPQVAEESPPSSLPRMVSSSSGGSLKRRPTSLSLVDLVAAQDNDDDAIMTAAPVSPLTSSKEEQQQTPGQNTCSSPHSSSPWGHFVDHLSPSTTAQDDDERMMLQGSSSFLPLSLSYNPHKRIVTNKKNRNKNHHRGSRAPFHAPYPKYTLKAKSLSKYPASLSLSMTNSSKTTKHHTSSFSLQPRRHSQTKNTEDSSTMLLSAMTLLRMD